MLPWLGEQLIQFYGPFRLLTSRLFLIGLGVIIASAAAWLLLPRLMHRLPTDKGRSFAVDADKSLGKPVGAGVIFVTIFIITSVLILPFEWRWLGVLGCTLLAMIEGYLDDKSHGGWSELKLGLVDLAISIMGAILVCQFQTFEIWVPLIKTSIYVPPIVFIPFATGLIWLTINATNCTDGVDGLSGSLSALAFVFLGGILYGIVGHQDISKYLLVPLYPDGSTWAMMSFVMVGCLSAYLWYNAFPSAMLMGDAGSRPVGFLLGTLVLACGNPFLIFVVAGVILVNGATGLLKLALLRAFKFSIFKSVRYPLHDHVRNKYHWSPTQVLVRFALLQALGSPLLLLLLLKVR